MDLMIRGPKRCLVGRVVRFISGHPGAVQTTDDLADDLRALPEFDQLQLWARQALMRHASGDIRLTSEVPYWCSGSVSIDPAEVPPFVTQRWSDPPHVSICRGESGRAECVAFDWYLHGFVIGPPGFSMPFKPWYSTQVAAGVHAYHGYK